MRTARVSGITRAAGRAPRYGQAGDVGCSGTSPRWPTGPSAIQPREGRAARELLAELGHALSGALGPLRGQEE